MRKKTYLLLGALAAVGCTADDFAPSDELREQALANDGKADGSDLCAAFGLYGDGAYCDCYCPAHDPDCDDPVVSIYGPADLCEASCDSLDERACEAEPGCAWVTDEDGFPGPVSFCTDEPPPLPTPCDGLDEMTCEATMGCEWYTDEMGFPGPISFCRIGETEPPPPPPGPCDGLDEMGCESTMGCEWTSRPGFPGPISFCQIEETVPPPPGPCDGLDEMACESTMGCEWTSRPGFPGPISFCDAN